MKTKRGSRGETPLSFNFDVWVMVTIRPLCSPYPFDWRLSGPQRWSFSYLDSKSIPSSPVPTRPTLISFYSTSVTQANTSHSRTQTSLTHSPQHFMFLDCTRVRILVTCCTCIYKNIHFLSR
jgi:hypothetical protein